MKFRVIILFALVVLLIIVLYFNYDRIVLGYIFNKPVNKVTELKMKKGSIYLKDLRKGLNTEIKVISATSTEDFNPDEKAEYVFTNGLDIFYQVRNDTLILFVRKKVPEPTDFPQNLNVKQVELKNPDYMNLYNLDVEKNYEVF